MEGKECSAKPGISAQAGIQLGGGEVLATSTIQTLLLTTVDLSPGATAQLRLC